MNPAQLPAESPPPDRVRLVRPLSLGLAVEAWEARVDGRPAVLRRHPPRPAGSPWPPPPDPAALAAARHPSLARFLRAWTEPDGTVVHAFAPVPGLTLAAALRSGPLAPDRWAAAVAALARGLRWLHGRCPGAPRLHGDVAPGNAVLTPGGGARWLDVRADPSGTFPSGPGIVLGTLPYLSPEVLSGGPPSPESEVFSLGLVALSAATGPLPGTGARSPREVQAAWRDTPPASRADVLPLPARVLLHAMLSPAPADRPTAAEVAAYLR